MKKLKIWDNLRKVNLFIFYLSLLHATLRPSVPSDGRAGVPLDWWPPFDDSDDKKLAKFSIATNDSYKNASGEKITDTQWHNVIAWNKTAEIVEKYLTKGNEIAVEGKLTSRSYENKEGVKKYITEIVVNELLMLGGK